MYNDFNYPYIKDKKEVKEGLDKVHKLVVKTLETKWSSEAIE